MIVHGLIMHQTIMSHVPNTYEGLAPVDMGMIIPKTGLAVNIPNVFGGVNIQLVLPRYCILLIINFQFLVACMQLM